MPAGNIREGCYRYIGDLLCLDSYIPVEQQIQWPRGPTPMQLDNLSPYLSCHPDQSFASYIRRGFVEGFRIGFDRSAVSLHSDHRNHPSSLANPAVVEAHIQNEIQLGRLVGPIPAAMVSQVQSSPIGLVPKSHQVNKWRLIVDLSHPYGYSVNDGILPDLCSLSYSSVDEAVQYILQLGRGTELVKLDLKDAYRMIPIHPQDQHLLAITWQGATYIDRTLPFGLRSSPKIFTAVADTIAWVLHCHRVGHQLHYLDDFLFLGEPGSGQGAFALSTALELLQHLGIPVASHKIEGPSTTLTFLGISIDTTRFELRLPRDKLQHLQALLEVWWRKKFCRRKELESFLGHLSHAATVIKPGRSFLRELFTLLKATRAPHHFVRLNTGARADLCWWRYFLQDWNGVSFFSQPAHSYHVYSDASGTFGCGAFLQSLGWFQVRWPACWDPVNIAAKELVPIVITAALWGAQWAGHSICFHSDNMAVVAILGKGSSTDRLLMHLLRCLLFYAAYFTFHIHSEHIPGIMNVAADALSRNNLSSFSSLVPQTPQVQVPQSVSCLLLTQMPNWGSVTWTELFKTSLTEALHNPR